MSGRAGAGAVDGGGRPFHTWATLALTGLTAVTAVSMCRLFTGWSYLAPMLAVVVVGHALAALGRALRVPIVLALPIAVAGTVAAAGVVFHPRTALGGILPSADTISALRADLRLVLDQFSATVAPVVGRGAFATAAAALVGVCAPLADAFAFRAYGRGEAVVPTLVVFVFTSALGADRLRIPMAAAWIASAVVVTAILRSAHRAQQEPWVGGRRPRLARLAPAVVAIAALCATAAAAAAPHLPGARQRSLLDTRRRHAETTTIVSPLVEVRPHLVNQSNVEMFSVRADHAAYWRLMGLAEFDGNTWSPAPESLSDATGQFGGSPDGHHIEQTITIGALRGKIVPAAFHAVAVDTAVDLQWAGDSQSLLTLNDQPLQRGDRFVVDSVQPSTDPARLAAATASRPPDPIYLRLPDGLPREAADIARQIAASASTPYDEALALQSFFRDHFTYSVNVPRGHSADAMRQFLEIRTGYCEQFSATYATIARMMGLPARVAVGFTPGELGADGLYHVAGRYAHAWPEVWFDGIGWVAFEPTPGRGEPGNEAVTGISAQQDGQAPPPDQQTADTQPPDSVPADSTPQAAEPPPDQANPPTPPTVAADPATAHDSSFSPWWWLAIAAAAVAGWLLAMPELVRRRRRARYGPDPADRILAAWHEAERAMSRVGAGHDPGLPAPSVAQSCANLHARTVDARAVARLADQVTVAMYSGGEPSPDQVAESEALAAHIRDDCRRALPWRQRLRGLLDPRQVL